jgi:hypothetical protein
MEKENFSLKTRVYFLEDTLSHYVDNDEEVTKDQLIYELQENQELLENANETITDLRTV